MQRRITFVQLPLVTKAKLAPTEEKYYDRYWQILGQILGSNFNKQEVYTVPEFPLWVTTLANAATDAGWQPSFIDFAGFIGPREKMPITTFVEALSRETSDAFAFSPYTANFSLARRISHELQEKVSRTTALMLGGAHATATADYCVQNGFDLVVRGRGEATLFEILTSFNAGSPHNLEKILGLTFRSQSRIIATKDRPKNEDFYLHRLPDYSLIPKTYKVHFARVYCSLGCPYSCSFCADTLWIGMRPFFKEVDAIIREIKQIRERYGVDLFLFGDEVFTLYPDFVLKLCKRLKDEKIKWFCQTRANLVDETTLKVMKSSGCRLIQIGAESADDRVLRFLNKRVDFETVKHACSTAKQVGLGVLTYWMVGAPGETRASADYTLNCIKQLFRENLTDVVDYYICTPYPGTLIYEHPEKFEVAFETNDFDQWREDQPSVMRTKELSSCEIFDLWVQGLNEIVGEMELHLQRQNLVCAHSSDTELVQA